MQTRTTYPFSVEEEKKINHAMSVVGQRMLSPAVLQCALNNSNAGEWETNGIAVSQVTNFQGFVQDQINRLLNHFPDVFIYEYGNPTPGAIANAFIGQVNADLTVTPSPGNIDPRRLEFRVVKAELWRSVDELAGAFAHELMHQLGHEHRQEQGGSPRGGPQRDSFIYAFGDCVEFDGAPLGATAPIRFY